MCLLCCIMLVVFPVSEAPVPEGCPVCPHLGGAER